MLTKRRRLRAVSIVALIAFYLGLDAGAGLFWTWLRSGPAKRNDRLERLYRTPSPTYHHDLKPSVSTDSAMWGPIQYSVRTNSLGFKDTRVRDVPLGDSLHRVLFIGDSFTEGVGVPYDSTFVGLVARGVRPRGIEILNAAVASYSPIIYWKKTEDLLLRRHLHVDEVVVFFDNTDIRDEALYYHLDAAGNVAQAESLTVHRTWADISMASLIVRKVRGLTSPPAKSGTCPPRVCFATWLTDSTILRGWARAGLARADTHMTQLAALLRAQHTPLTLVVYPWAQDLILNNRDSPLAAHWQDWARREGVEFVSLYGAFFAHADFVGLQRVIDGYFIRDDVHWTSQGHQFVASSLMSSLFTRQHPAKK